MNKKRKKEFNKHKKDFKRKRIQFWWHSYFDFSKEILGGGEFYFLIYSMGWLRVAITYKKISQK